MAIVWPENCPDKLEDICVQFCATNTETFAIEDELNGTYKLQPGVVLPKSLCDKLIKALVGTNSKDYANKFMIFSDVHNTMISSLCLRGSKLTNQEFKCLQRQPIVDLELTDCRLLTKDSFETINKFKHTLKSLRIDGSLVLQLDNVKKEADSNTNCNPDNKFVECPNLRALCINNFDFLKGSDIDLKSLLFRMDKLTHLDLSDCGLALSDIQQLQHLPSLVSLGLCNVLHNVNKHFIEFIGKITKLRHLDISIGDESYSPVLYNEPDKTLMKLMNSLPNLVSLDISGTNLAGFEKVQTVSHRLEPKSKQTEYRSISDEECCIPGLKGRQLEFLGLLDCFHDPCLRKNIPAKKVTGDGNEEQILLGLHVYQDRPLLLYSVFNKLFALFQSDSVVDHYRALERLLDGMQRYPLNKHIQISGSASLFYITKGDHKDNLTQKQKRRIIDLVLEGMENFSKERTMMRNGCLTLCYFNVSQDVIYCYSRLSTVLLNMLDIDLQDDFIHRIGIYLLNCLACQVNREQKALVGDLGAINTMLKIIRRKLEEEQCDDMMEVAWSSMWNITDETATNCRKFIDGDGMNLFLQCLEMFKDRAELLRNMMGLMGNIAEVKEFRNELMVKEYISVFSELLDSTTDGIEVSYNAAGVLAHIASDGIEGWTIEDVPRDEVLARLTSAIQRWDITSKRNINYRSFVPILRLLVYFDTPQVQHWAIWALCNLTNVYPEKYCELLEKEDGVSKLKLVLEDPRTSPNISDLINDIFKTLEKYHNPTEQDMDSQ